VLLLAPAGLWNGAAKWTTVSACLCERAAIVGADETGVAHTDDEAPRADKAGRAVEPRNEA
jgi:hypothetical protein